MKQKEQLHFVSNPILIWQVFVRLVFEATLKSGLFIVKDSNALFANFNFNSPRKKELARLSQCAPHRPQFSLKHKSRLDAQ
eukprot:scaffold25161_cov42-Cyclotella_meneghiniana.AAC.3